MMAPNRRLEKTPQMIDELSKEYKLAEDLSHYEQKNIFLESAYFNPVSIRKSAKRHNLNTDASFRYERGIDPDMLHYALCRAIDLIIDLAGGMLDGNILEIGNKISQKSPIEFARSKLISTNANGFSKEFYIEISYITREFVEKSSFIRALEMTTDEIKLNQNIFLVNKNIFSDWIALLEKADLIKYAKQPASISEMEKDKKKALDIIENIFTKQ